jgi:hypothetical protein
VGSSRAHARRTSRRGDGTTDASRARCHRMSVPFVSVVIPCRNERTYIGHAWTRCWRPSTRRRQWRFLSPTA